MGDFEVLLLVREAYGSIACRQQLLSIWRNRKDGIAVQRKLLQRGCRAIFLDGTELIFYLFLS